MADAVKILGWGRCSVGDHDDIIENSTSLSVEEGQEQEANIEGGSAEGRKKAPDKYILTYKRRVGSASEVKVGFTENVEEVTVTPENDGAVGVTLKNVSKHVAVGFDSTDGLTATYTYKTKGQTGQDGNLTDVQLN